MFEYLFLLFIILIAIIYFIPEKIIDYLESFYPDVIFRLPNRSPNNTSDSSYKPTLCITIDDAPYTTAEDSSLYNKLKSLVIGKQSCTLDILDILKKYNISVTFFIISSFAKQNPLIIKRILEDGHELGNHLDTDSCSILHSKESFENELLTCDNFIQKHNSRHNNNNNDSNNDSNNTINNKVKWLRPGSGFFNQRMIDQCKAHNYHIVLGNIYPHDAHIHSSYLNEWYINYKLKDNSIIILHDRSWTPQLLNNLLPVLIKKSYQFKTLSQVFTNTNNN